MSFHNVELESSSTIYFISPVSRLITLLKKGITGPVLNLIPPFFKNEVNLHSRSARPITNKIHFVGGVLTVRYGYKPTGLTIINDDIPRTEHLGRDKISNLKLQAF